ncbi:MAG: efflux RND transporter permease subunit, partial [Bacilli bacterium]
TTTNLKYALASSTNMTGAGNLTGPTSHFVLFPETQLSTAEDYEKIVIGFKDGSPIYLRDIAKAINAIQFDTLNINFFNSAVPSDKSTAQIAMGISAPTVMQYHCRNKENAQNSGELLSP